MPSRRPKSLSWRGWLSVAIASLVLSLEDVTWPLTTPSIAPLVSSKRVVFSPLVGDESNRPPALPRETLPDVIASVRTAGERWHSTLSADPAFQSLRAADDLSVEPLDTGGALWRVLFTQAASPVGYLIVCAAKDGDLRLMEYGVGGIPLFDRRLLPDPTDTANIDRPRPVYRGIASAFVTPGEGRQATEAKTGEPLPSTALTPGPSDPHAGICECGALQKATVTPDARLVRIAVRPYRPEDEAVPVAAVIRGSTPLKAAEALFSPDQTFLVLSKRPWTDDVNVLRNVLGAHRFSGGETYVAVAEEGLRFLPLLADVSGNTAGSHVPRHPSWALWLDDLRAVHPLPPERD